MLHVTDVQTNEKTKKGESHCTDEVLGKIRRKQDANKHARHATIKDRKKIGLKIRGLRNCSREQNVLENTKDPSGVPWKKEGRAGEN